MWYHNMINKTFQNVKRFIAIWKMFIVQKHCTEIKPITYILCHLYLHSSVTSRQGMQENHCPNQAKNY